MELYTAATHLNRSHLFWNKFLFGSFLRLLFFHEFSTLFHDCHRNTLNFALEPTNTFFRSELLLGNFIKIDWYFELFQKKNQLHFDLACFRWLVSQCRKYARSSIKYLLIISFVVFRIVDVLFDFFVVD